MAQSFSTPIFLPSTCRFTCHHRFHYPSLSHLIVRPAHWRRATNYWSSIEAREDFDQLNASTSSILPRLCVLYPPPFGLLPSSRLSLSLSRFFLRTFLFLFHRDLYLSVPFRSVFTANLLSTKFQDYSESRGLRRAKVAKGAKTRKLREWSDDRSYLGDRPRASFSQPAIIWNFRSISSTRRKLYYDGDEKPRALW